MARIDPALAERLDDSLRADLDRNGRLGKVQRYLDGDHEKPYTPRGASKEFEHIRERSVDNWLPLISDTFGKTLAVAGYRPGSTSDNAPAWSFWQANGLDARQTIAHRGALNYGTSYALVLPGTLGAKRIPYFRPLSPLRTAALYRDVDDEFPEVAFRRIGTTADGTSLCQVFDRTSAATFYREKDATDWRLSKTETHGLGVTPFVRFRDRLDGEAQGIIRPLIPLQDRVNEIVFSTMIALQYASFRQRWATGLVIPEDEDGNPTAPFEAAVNRLWVAEDEGVRFGDFAQTETSGHQAAYSTAVGTLAAIAQINPAILTGDLVNVSADALAALQDATQAKADEYRLLFGEAWESGFRLASRAAGDLVGAADMDAQVRWKDTTVRTLAQTVDALGKIAQMLSVPVEELWSRIPDVTDQDVERWKAARKASPIADLAAAISKRSTEAEQTADPEEQEDEEAAA